MKEKHRWPTTSIRVNPEVLHSPLLRDRLHQEGVWEDLRQEIHLAAWEAVENGLGEKETWRLAARHIYAFLKANGYQAYR